MGACCRFFDALCMNAVLCLFDALRLFDALSDACLSCLYTNFTYVNPVTIVFSLTKPTQPAKALFTCKYKFYQFFRLYMSKQWVCLGSINSTNDLLSCSKL
jgi:hypothetical protein